MSESDVVGRLWMAVCDQDMNTLSEIMHAAGVLWRCLNSECRADVREEDAVCGECGAGRDGGFGEFQFQYRREQRVDFTVVAGSLEAAEKLRDAYVANLGEGWDESDDPGETELLTDPTCDTSTCEEMSQDGSMYCESHDSLVPGLLAHIEKSDDDKTPHCGSKSTFDAEAKSRTHRTEDGYTFHKVGDVWTDGDMVFPADGNGIEHDGP